MVGIKSTVASVSNHTSHPSSMDTEMTCRASEENVTQATVVDDVRSRLFSLVSQRNQLATGGERVIGCTRGAATHKTKHLKQHEHVADGLK